MPGLKIVIIYSLRRLSGVTRFAAANTILDIYTRFAAPNTILDVFTRLAGVLALPAALNDSGWVGLLLLFVLALTSAYTAVLIGRYGKGNIFKRALGIYTSGELRGNSHAFLVARIRAIFPRYRMTLKTTCRLGNEFESFIPSDL